MDTKEFFKKARRALKDILRDRPSEEFGKPLKNVRPIFEKRGEQACLMLHGWTSTPFEFKALCDFLKERDITCIAPLLPGHGTSFLALKNVTYRNWTQESEKEFLKISKNYKKVFLIGNSIGGNLSFVLASRHKNVKGIISIGTPIYFRHHELSKALLEIISLFKEDVNKRYSKGVDKEIIKRRKHYRRFPLKSVKEVLKLMDLTRKALPKIKAPTFIIQSEVDHLLDKSNAHEIYNRISSEKKELKFVPDAYHVVVDDHHHFDIFKEIYEFIRENS